MLASLIAGVALQRLFCSRSFPFVLVLENMSSPRFFIIFIMYLVW